MKDLYSLLNIPTNANQAEIKKSYRKLAFQCHPDKNKDPSAQQEFQAISEAYEILSNPPKRQTYDQFGYDAVKEIQGTGTGPVNPIELFQSLFNVDFTREMNSNIFFFSDLTGNPFTQLQHKMIHPLPCSLEELYFGTKKEFSINHTDSQGLHKSTKYVINVKAGSKDGENIVVKEGGNHIPLLKVTEDLVIQIKETKHSLYKRQGDDLYMEYTISLCDALCPCQFTIPHFKQDLVIEIQDIIKPNSLFQVFGSGMPIKQTSTPSLDNGSESTTYGNLILDLKIEFPEHLSEKRQGYLKQILGTSAEGAEGTEGIGEEQVKEGVLVTQAFFYKDKEEVMKELMNEEEEESLGCLHQ
jgi:DnaJ family protein B protein 4